MDEKDLLKLKKEIDKKKSQISELEGRKKYLIQQLKEEWDCASFKDAKSKLKKYEDEFAVIKEKLDTGLAEIEEDYQEVLNNESD